MQYKDRELKDTNWYMYEISNKNALNSTGDIDYIKYIYRRDFPGSSTGKEFACNAADPGLIPGSGISPGEGIRYPLQYSCLDNPMNRGAWQATVHGLTESDTTE